MGRPRKEVRSQTTAITLSDLHLSLLDYLCQHNPGFTRSGVIRQAVEDFVRRHVAWDENKFQALAAQRAKGLPEARAAGLARDIRRFLTGTVPTDIIFDPAYLDVSTDKSIFE